MKKLSFKSLYNSVVIQQQLQWSSNPGLFDIQTYAFNHYYFYL